MFPDIYFFFPKERVVLLAFINASLIYTEAAWQATGRKGKEPLKKKIRFLRKPSFWF